MNDGYVSLSPVDGKQRRLHMWLKGAYLHLDTEELSSTGEWHIVYTGTVTLPISSSTDLADIAAKLVVMWEARRDEEIAERTAKAR